MVLENQKLAECVGLWLAEGDKKTKAELTFTNNSLDLILFFKEAIDKIYSGENKPRLYVYSPSDRQLFTKFNGFKKIKFYVDTRANRPYYIYRLADTNFVKKWKLIVKDTIENEEHFPDVLRGIFAGEGNVKHDLNHNSRALRIASKYKNRLIERILTFYGIDFRFDSIKRTYWLKANSLTKLEDIRIAKLHPEKESKFRGMVNCIYEVHYPPGQLKCLILHFLTDDIKTTKELSNLLKRSQLRILGVLQELKGEGKIDWVKINNTCFWAAKHKKEAFLNKEKRKVLSQINNLNSFSKLGKKLRISRKYISKQFVIYQDQGLVEKSERWWKLTEEGKKLVLGVDEAGSKLQEHFLGFP